MFGKRRGEVTQYFVLVFLAVAGLDWVGTARGWNRARWITKPAALVLLIAWFSLFGGWRGPLLWFGLALVFSLLGDVLLIEKLKMFVFGLLAFLLAHLAYLVGFNLTLPPLSLPVLGLVAVGAIAVGILFPTVRRGLVRQPGGGGLILPVFVYSLVLSLMMISAVSTLFRLEWHQNAAIFAAAGGVLFFISDSLLALNRFVRPIRQGDLLVMVTYHLGQLGLALGAILNFV
jgi:alkenylglycerophosphocholine/alkenylglycerophosphoethanolamine hydrolase